MPTIGGHVIITTVRSRLGRRVSSAGWRCRTSTSRGQQFLRTHSPARATGRPDGPGLRSGGRWPWAGSAWWQATRTPLDVSDGANPADRLTTVAADGYGRTVAGVAVRPGPAGGREPSGAAPAGDCSPGSPRCRSPRTCSAGAEREGGAGARRGAARRGRADQDHRRALPARPGPPARGRQRVEVMPLARLVAWRALTARGDRPRPRSRARAAGRRRPRLARRADRRRHCTGRSPRTWRRPGWSRPAAARSGRWCTTRSASGTCWRPRRACGLGERAYVAWRVDNDPAPDDQLVLRTSQEWANALRAVGRYEGAGELTRGAMSQLRAIPCTASSTATPLPWPSQPGRGPAHLRRLPAGAGVRPGDAGALRVRFGDDHPRTTMSRHNLAISLRLTGDFSAAERLDRSALAGTGTPSATATGAPCCRSTPSPRTSTGRAAIRTCSTSEPS